MTDQPQTWAVDDGSLALALQGQTLRHLVQRGIIDHEAVALILSDVVSAAGSPAAQQGARQRLKALFPGTHF